MTGTNGRALIIYRLGSLGDTLVALPCFARIVEAFPDRRRLALTNFPVSRAAPPLEAILKPGGFIDGVIEYPLGTRSPRALLAVRKAIRQTGADTLIYLAASRGLSRLWRDLLFFRLCGIRRIVAAPSNVDLQRNRELGDGHAIEPEAERLARTLHELGPLDLSSRAAWDLRLTAPERDAARELLAPLAGLPFIAVNMGGKAANNDWGEAQWIALARSTVDRIPEAPVVVIGGDSDSARASRFIAAWPHGGLDLCGQLTPRESAALLSRAAFFVGHDSGPMHLAATAGIPCVALLGNNNRPRKWHPYGAGHRVLHRMGGVAEITVDEVAEAMRDCWQSVASTARV